MRPSTLAFCSVLSEVVLTSHHEWTSEGHIHSFQVDIAFEGGDYHSTHCTPCPLLGPQLPQTVPWGLDKVLMLTDAAELGSGPGFASCGKRAEGILQTMFLIVVGVPWV